MEEMLLEPSSKGKEKFTELGEFRPKTSVPLLPTLDHDIGLDRSI